MRASYSLAIALPEHLAEQGRDLSLVLIDLDNFKSINETYGKTGGDQVLRECGDLLLDICRCSDFVTRWKGDQFLVIARQPRGGEAEGLAVVPPPPGRSCHNA